MFETEPVLFAKSLADETRQKIMRMVCCKWLSVNEIVEQLNVTQPTVSHHLAILRQAGLVRGERRGSFVHYTLDLDGIRRYKTALGNVLGKNFLAR